MGSVILCQEPRDVEVFLWSMTETEPLVHLLHACHGDFMRGRVCGLLCFYFVEEVSSVALFSKASNPSFNAASEVIWENIQAGTTISRNSAISFFESSSSFEATFLRKTILMRPSSVTSASNPVASNVRVLSITSRKDLLDLLVLSRNVAIEASRDFWNVKIATLKANVAPIKKKSKQLPGSNRGERGTTGWNYRLRQGLKAAALPYKVYHHACAIKARP